MNDLISRQQAIDALRAMQTYKMFAGDDLLLIGQAGAQTELMMLPSAQSVSSSCGHENDVISRQMAIDALRTCYDTETVTMDNGDEYINYGDAVGEIEQLPSAQPEQRWIPVAEIPPRGKDLILKIYDKHNLFYYYHMGFHDGEKYYTYNFFWWEDKDLEIVGWQLCPWEEEEQE